MFVQGEPPYEGQFAPDPAALGPGFAALAEFAVIAARIAQPTVHELIHLIVQLWGRPWPEIIEILGSTDFARALDRAWQNVFALNCVLGYDRGSLASMIHAIVAATLLQRIAGSGHGEESEAAWTPERLREGLRATLVLPSPVFPLPAAEVTIEAAPAPIVILPYAIGDLHLVKRRLLGYTLGEVSHIESVMADEKKLRAQHERVEDESRQANHALEQNSHDEERSGSGASLEAQVRNTLHEQFQVDYTTSYGPPTEARQTGSYTMKPLDDKPGRDTQSQRADLARRITQRAAQRVTSRLGEQRLHHRRHARQSEISQCFDRRGRSENQRGIYRWLDARYRCWVVRVGRRLMLEYFVPHPASRLTAAEREFRGLDLVQPVSPAQLGLRQFDDISLDPLSELYYATLAARYGVEGSDPPPPELAYACAVFETGAPLLSQVMALPAGYAAATATLALTSATAGLSARGRIGASGFGVTGEGDTGKQTVTLAGQTDTLPISVAVAVAPTASADGGASLPTYGLNVEVELQRTAVSLSRWKSHLYDRVLEGYRRQQARYFEAAGVAHAQQRTEPLARQRTIRGELKRAGMRGFLQVSAHRTGELRREGRFAPALRLWLEQAVEWAELTYTLIDDPDSESAGGGDGEPFTEFLQAAYARVLLPVAPDREHALLYFLASGMVWNGEDALAPTFDTSLDDDVESSATVSYVDLVDDLKSSSSLLEPMHAQDSWTLTLPTAMSVLQDGDRLPEFPERP